MTFQVNVADMNDFVDRKPPHCKVIVQSKVVTTPQDLHLVATMNGLKQPKTIELHKKAQFVDLVFQVFYHKHKRSHNWWRVTLAVFPKRLCEVSSCKCTWTIVAELMYAQVLCCAVSYFQH